jgi:hypothetical protein
MRPRILLPLASSSPSVGADPVLASVYSVKFNSHSLFNTAAGSIEKPETIASLIISIYADGFQHAVGLKSRSHRHAELNGTGPGSVINRENNEKESQQSAPRKVNNNENPTPARSKR